MHLIQILLPLAGNEGEPIEPAEFRRVAEELTERFGGVTAFTRAPAEGRWKEGGGEAEHDEIVVLEVMAEELNRGFWRDYRTELERRFRQQEIVVRAQAIERL